jgi:hypothetical protein
MKEDIKSLKFSLIALQATLKVDSLENRKITISQKKGSKINTTPAKRIFVKIYSEIAIDNNTSQTYLTKYLVATYDKLNIRITIDASKNHGRPHIHIGIRQDKYHSASIAIDNGNILNNTGNIAEWKVRKIIEWANENKHILEKIYRCVNTWGDSPSADKRQKKLKRLE